MGVVVAAVMAAAAVVMEEIGVVTGAATEIGVVMEIGAATEIGAAMGIGMDTMEIGIVEIGAGIMDFMEDMDGGMDMDIHTIITTTIHTTHSLIMM